MENYFAYCPKEFEITIEEIKKLPASGKMSMVNYQQNLDAVKNFFHRDIMEFTLKDIPKGLKRNKWDNACLIIYRRPTGYFAKRFNNSQWLKII